MKTPGEILAMLKDFERAHGIAAANAHQGSEDWQRLRLGVATASQASKIVAKRDSEARYSYLCELVAQVCTGEVKEFTTQEMQWGKDHEDAARSTFEFNTGNKIIELPFVFKDGRFREGCSPDGIINDDKGIEIKCPFNTVHFIKFLDEARIKPEYQWQAQFTMRVMDAGEWDFGQYDPRMSAKTFHAIPIKRDEEKQKILADCVPQFLSDMDAILKKIGVTYGNQWKRSVL